MESAIDFRAERSRVKERVNASAGRALIVTGLLALASLGAATAAQAQPGVDAGASGEHTPDSPWTPEVIAATDAYIPSPAFNGGRLSLDHFADSNSADQQGLVTAELANGNIVVAGLVPDGAAESGSCGDGTKLCSIGLVRYTPTGQRVAWPNAGVNGRFSDNYVVYPGGSSSLRYQYLHDVSVRGNYIDVLVDEPDANHTEPTLGHRNVRIYTFRDDGSFLGQYPAFGAGTAAMDNEDFYGAQMTQIDAVTMIVAATGYDTVGPYIAVTRLAILGNGALSLDNGWGTPYGGSFINRINRYFAPGFCSEPVGGRCNVTASYVARQEGFATPTDFYVGGSLPDSGDDYDVMTLKISSSSGAAKTEFGGTGWVRTAFDQTGSNHKDLAAGLYVYQDEVYLAAQVAQKCFDGIGMAKLNGATGGLVTAFGSAGKLVFGGEGNDTICFNIGTFASVPTAIAATGGRIGIVGYQTSRIVTTLNINPMLAVVNAVDGSVLDLASHAVLRADGSRYGDAVLYGIYGGPNPTSPFTVSGLGRDVNSGNTLSYVTGRLIPVSGDRIFASNFGIGNDN